MPSSRRSVGACRQGDAAPTGPYWPLLILLLCGLPLTHEVAANGKRDTDDDSHNQRIRAIRAIDEPVDGKEDEGAPCDAQPCAYPSQTGYPGL